VRAEPTFIAHTRPLPAAEALHAWPCSGRRSGCTIGVDDTGLSAHLSTRDGREVAVLEQPLAYFIPEHGPDPSIRPPGEELWVEVTLPKHGAPRPIRLGIKKAGALTVLDLD